MILAALLCLALALYCYAISQLQQHGKLKWMNEKNAYGYWGKLSWKLKYKLHDGDQYMLQRAPDNWYYKLIGQPYKERWLTSTWLTVSLTDGYHFSQFMFFNFLSLAFTLAIGWDWYLFGGLIVGVRIANWSARKVFSK